jgi:quercetin dioxygenase-like cupin family protein
MKPTLLAVMAASVAVGAAAQSPTPSGPPAERRAYNAGELQYVPAPPALPKGVMVAVLSGNPGLPGPFVMRLKVPPGFELKRHRHATDENQTILEGYVLSGTGDFAKDPTLRRLSVGAFSLMPAGTTHYVKAPDGAVIQVHGIGPFTAEYEDPRDDPRAAAPPAR